jgi:hypothetical protein
MTPHTKISTDHRTGLTLPSDKRVASKIFQTISGPALATCRPMRKWSLIGLVSSPASECLSMDSMVDALLRSHDDEWTGC